MKALYQSDRNEGSLINLVFNPSKASDKAKAEVIGQWLVDNIGYDWVSEDEDILTIGLDGVTVQEMKSDYKKAKAEVQKDKKEGAKETIGQKFIGVWDGTSFNC